MLSCRGFYLSCEFPGLTCKENLSLPPLFLYIFFHRGSSPLLGQRTAARVPVEPADWLSVLHPAPDPQALFPPLPFWGNYETFSANLSGSLSFWTLVNPRSIFCIFLPDPAIENVRFDPLFGYTSWVSRFVYAILS